MTCPTYLTPWQGQNPAVSGDHSTYRDANGVLRYVGWANCTAFAAAAVIAGSTCGDRTPTGKRIRELSSEPIPDPRSPGLNLSQVADVAWDHFGVYFDVRTGWRALDWAEYEDRRKGGAKMVVQLSYAPIAESPFDAGRGFVGGHAISEDQHDTLDPLADGRAKGVYEHTTPLSYPRSLIREAAGDLIIGHDGSGFPIRVGNGKVWAAVGRDTAPEYIVRIRPRKGHERRHFRVFTIRNGRITGYDSRTTRGVPAAGQPPVPCDPPRAFTFPTHDDRLRYLVRVRGGHFDGEWIRRTWAHEVSELAGLEAAMLIPDSEDEMDILREAALDSLDDPDETVPDVRTDPYPAHEEEAPA